MPRVALLGVYFYFLIAAPVYSAEPQMPFETNAPFGDCGFLPPAGTYTGRLFHLSQQYPAELPNMADRPLFFKIDFRTQWRDYLLAVRSYCFEGNVGDKDVENDFAIENDKSAKWFHMPWQHYGPFGREGIHGLTKEAPIQPGQLASSQQSSGQTYAVAFYNRFGGYEIGQVWKHHEQPELHDIKFPVGTVEFKLLFADIPQQEVPFLAHPVVWQAYITKAFDSNDRTIKNLMLIQMDVMVRDDQSPGGWIFGTFQYNGVQGKANPWENLVPVGIQWGDDPDVTENAANPQPKQTIRNSTIKETIINDDDTELPPTHLGWNGRLNGPVDNPQSSCMSCHATAQVRVKSPLSPLFQPNPPIAGSEEWMRWFRNYKCGERFDADVPSADFSLQLAISVKNYQQWRGEEHGIRTTNYAFQAKQQSGNGLGSKFSDTLFENGVPIQQPRIQRDIQQDDR